MLSFGRPKTRGGSRTTVTSNMEHFVIMANDWKPLTIMTKHFILDVAAVLDPPLENCLSHLCNIHSANVGCTKDILHDRIEHKYLLYLRKFENKRNNVCLIPLLDACSFSRWCTFLKMFEIPA